MNISLGRLLLSVPPGTLLLMSLVMLAMAPSAWGAADHVEIPSWMPAASGLAFGFVGVLIGGLTLREVLRETRGEYEVSRLLLLLGIVLLEATAYLQVVAAMRVADGATYDGFRNADRELTITPSAFLIFTFFGLLIGGAVIAGCAYTYTKAIWSSNTPRIARRSADESDGVGEMLRRTRV